MKRLASTAAAFAAMSLAVVANATATSYGDRLLSQQNQSAGSRSADIAPDDRVMHRPAAVSVGPTADIAPDDRVLHRPGSDVTITPVVQRSTAGDTFDWADAGIGAAGMAGLALLGAGAALILRRREQAAFS
jgi:hypothetical protein